MSGLAPLRRGEPAMRGAASAQAGGSLERVLPALALAGTAVTISAGLVLHLAAGVTLGTPLPPFIMSWAPQARWPLLVAIAVAAATRRSRSPRRRAGRAAGAVRGARLPGDARARLRGQRDPARQRRLEPRVPRWPGRIVRGTLRVPVLAALSARRRGPLRRWLRRAAARPQHPRQRQPAGAAGRHASARDRHPRPADGGVRREPARSVPRSPTRSAESSVESGAAASQQR